MTLSRTELNSLYRYALALIKDEAKAYDLVQTAIVKSLNREISSPLPYLRKAIRHAFYDLWRENQRFEQQGVEFNELSESISLAEFNDLETSVLDRDHLDKLMQSIEPLDREILYLWAVEEWTFAEISTYLDIKRGTLLSRIHRLRQKFQTADAQGDKNEITS